MKATNFSIDFKNIRTYKNKKIINIFKKMTDEDINLLIDSSVVEFISTLDGDTINSLFRNSGSSLQNKLWNNDIIQRVLIFGKKDITNLHYDEQVIRNLENLNKIIKSQSIKKQVYTNKYFITVLTSDIKIENRFFHSYDINKVFESIVYSEQFKSLSSDKQLIIIEKLNSYTNDILLPIDFRQRYKNIERILFSIDISKLDENIISQLNDDELFFIDYIRNDKNNNQAIKKDIIENIKSKGKSFEQFMDEMKTRDNLINGRIRDVYKQKYYYNSVDLMQKVFEILLHEIDDELIREKMLRYLLPIIMKDSSVNSEAMYNTLKRNLNYNLLTYIDINNLTSQYDYLNKDLRLIFYLKFNISLTSARYLSGITAEQLSKINVKHINKLFKFLEDKTQDELSSIYGICIKLYFIFGYKRSIEILSGKYGEYNRIFLDNVAKTDVSKVLMIEEGNKYLPSINRRFIDFMFENPKNNHFIDMLNNKNSELYKRWYYVYNNYDKILEKCHNKITMKKIVSILETEKYDINRKIITPDCYLLNNNDFLENIVLGNKTVHSNDDVLKSIVDIYRKMKKRVESSIPYVKGTSEDGYIFQTLKFDDYKIFELGYKANCCIRTLDIAHNHLLHAALCRNGRILLIYDKLGDLVAFCPIKRNGNVLIVNSIECVDKRFDKTGDYIKTAFSQCIQEIVNTSISSNEPIELVCIGRNSYLKPNVVQFPTNVETPTIYEKEDDTYKNTDIYHKSLDIVYKADNFNFESIKKGNPNVSYNDPRPSIISCDFWQSSEEEQEKALNAINAIRYSSSELEKLENFRLCERYGIQCCIYNKDWYILKAFDGNIYGDCLKDDERAITEYNIALQEFQNKFYSEQQNDEVKLVKKFKLPR